MILIEAIAKETRLPQPYLARLALTAGHRYKLYTIPKRSGGERLIAHPARTLKSIQRWLGEHLFSDIPLHEAAAAYRAGRGIKENAAIHLQGNFLLKLDIKDFFPSLKAADVGHLLNEKAAFLKFALTAEDVEFVQRIVTRQGSLPVGAPSSPTLSNQLMYEFDSVVSVICAEREVQFTRYADDMFFSTNIPNVLPDVHSSVIEVLREMAYPKLRLNHQKTVYTSRRRRRMVTGIVLTSDKKISLGRKKKRELRALLQRYRDGALEPPKKDYVAGYLAYANSVEPEFILSLRAKYGAELIDGIFKAKLAAVLAT